MPSHPITHDVLLLGGGHSHAIALRLWGMNPLPGVRLTLLTDGSDTPYSGMLPGHVAGSYSRDLCHIDLRSLCQFAGAQLLIDRAIGLDLANHRVLCAQRPPIAFDLLSIDIGSTPTIPDLPEGSPQGITAKPVPQFLAWWERLCDRLNQSPHPLTLGIIGGGAGGVELSLTMHHRLQALYQPTATPFKVHLFQRGAALMPQHNSWVRRQFQQLLTDRGIQVHLQAHVESVQLGQILCTSGLTVACDEIVWVTHATAPDWLRQAGLGVTAAGFVAVNEYLQSISHPTVFAAGDVATMIRYDRPKAGVFAVRQGPPLVKNLQRAVLGQSLHPYHPQAHVLGLIGTADGSAVASWGSVGWRSRWLWQWKDRIDRSFMQKFSHLPPMPPNPDTDRGYGSKQPSVPQMHCLGCGAKVGSQTLAQVLHRIHSDRLNSPPLPRSQKSCDHALCPESLAVAADPSTADQATILIDLSAPDDAAVLQIPAGKVLVQTVDYFPAFLSDPYLFGQIATHHSLSDLFAMGAVPHSALAIATIPYGTPAHQAETLYQVLSGAIKALQAVNAQLVGGHTTEGETLAFGLSCNGLATPDHLLCKSGLQPGQVLILTKPIGTGTLLAAALQRRAKPQWIDGAIDSMLHSNQSAAACFLQHQATACTDITGFGLLGHIGEMVRASGVAVELDLAALPVLAGARATTQQGIMSSLYAQNLQASELIAQCSRVSTHPDYPLLFDPQTSGGLLASVPASQAAACLVALHQVGLRHSAIVGRVLPASPGEVPTIHVISS
jgi:selenide, water dikinase